MAEQSDRLGEIISRLPFEKLEGWHVCLILLAILAVVAYEIYKGEESIISKLFKTLIYWMKELCGNFLQVLNFFGCLLLLIVAGERMFKACEVLDAGGNWALHMVVGLTFLGIFAYGLSYCQSLTRCRA